jgi:hypothetical protein
MVTAPTLSDPGFRFCRPPVPRPCPPFLGSKDPSPLARRRWSTVSIVPDSIHKCKLSPSPRPLLFSNKDSESSTFVKGKNVDNNVSREPISLRISDLGWQKLGTGVLSSVQSHVVRLVMAHWPSQPPIRCLPRGPRAVVRFSRCRRTAVNSRQFIDVYQSCQEQDDAMRCDARCCIPQAKLVMVISIRRVFNTLERPHRLGGNQGGMEAPTWSNSSRGGARAQRPQNSKALELKPKLLVPSHLWQLTRALVTTK